MGNGLPNERLASSLHGAYEQVGEAKISWTTNKQIHLNCSPTWQSSTYRRPKQEQPVRPTTESCKQIGALHRPAYQLHDGPLGIG